MFNAMKQGPKQFSYFLVKVFRVLTTKRNKSWFLTYQILITRFTFFVHNSIVNFIFDKPEPIYKFNISQELLTKLNDWVLNANEVNDLWSKESYGLILDQKISSENIKKFKKEKIHFDTSTLSKGLLKQLHNEIRHKIKESVGSPFIFTNTKIWSLTPINNKKTPGLATETHQDGFMNGHMKIMIYTKPMNEAYGSIEIDSHIYKDESPGGAILFQNSKILHRGTRGVSQDRISIEITLFRAIIDKEQIHPGHPKGRHYRSILKSYMS